MNRIKNHMQYYKFFQLGNTDWFSNGHMAIKERILHAEPIRYSKYAIESYLYKPRTPTELNKAIARFNQFLRLPMKDIDIDDRAFEKADDSYAEGLTKREYQAHGIKHLWRLWYDPNTSYIFNADLVGFLLYRLKGQAITWNVGIYEDKLPLLFLYDSTGIAGIIAAIIDNIKGR